jgi:hypothetical protein
MSSKGVHVVGKEGQLGLDLEWKDLIREALEEGITPQEIREFFLARSSVTGKAGSSCGS